MSFLEKLAKGFIRSAVNQVGRDTGKVVSNKLYKGKHSTPIYNHDPVALSNNNIAPQSFEKKSETIPIFIADSDRNLSSNYYNLDNEIVYVVNNQREITKEQYIQAGFKATNNQFTGNAVLITLVSFVPILGLITIFFGIEKLAKKDIEYSGAIILDDRKPDKRYSEGYRLEMKPRQITVKFKATPEEQRRLKNNSIYYFILFFISIGMTIWAFS